MLTVNAKIKDFFFDRMQVIARIDKDRLRFLRNAGGFARKTARTSMKRKGKARPAPKNQNGRAYQRWLEEIQNQPASQPGSPPYVHSDSPVQTLKNILFAFDTSSGGVVVGPVGLGRSLVPSLHERGGTAAIPEKQVVFPNGGRKWVPIGKRGARPGQATRKRLAKYPARPFMKPAMQKTQSKFKSLWFTNARDMRAAG